MRKKLFVSCAFLITSAVLAKPLKGKWIGDSGRFLNWHLDFIRPGHAVLIFEHMDGKATIDTRYTIDANSIVSFQDFSAVKGDIEQGYADSIKNTLSTGKCTILNTDASLTNLWGLSCLNGEKKFWDSTRLVPAGAKRKIGDLDVVTMGVRSGKTTTCTRLRSLPSAESSLIEYLPEDQSGAKNCAPAGTPLILLARTQTKTKVGNALNFWYYVSIGHQQQVWVFGDLIKF